MDEKNKFTGKYFTPIGYSDFIVDYFKAQINSFKGELRILEPSCGEGNLINSIVKKIEKQNISIKGVEIDEEIAQICKENYAKDKRIEIINSDFCDFIPKDNTLYDFIIGNPPFVRYRRLETKHRKIINRFFDLKNYTKKLGSGKNLWIYFLLNSIERLTKNGILSFVLPIELLDNKSLHGIRDYLLIRFNRIEIIKLRGAIFSNVGAKSQETILLNLYLSKKTMSGIYFGEVTSKSQLKNKVKFKKRKVHNLYGKKWTVSRVQIGELKNLNKFYSKHTTFNNLSHISPGIVTAANNFFIVPNSTVVKFNLKSYVVPILPRSSFLNGHTKYSKKDFQNLIHKEENCYLLRIKDTDLIENNSGLNSYIKSGELEKIHLRYKCKLRKNWYVIPNTDVIGDLLFTKRFHDYPKLVANVSNVRATDSLYKIVCSDKINKHSLCMSFYNSLTFSYLELTGKVLSEGACEISPKELSKCPIPYKTYNNKEYEIFEKKFKQSSDIADFLLMNDKVVLSHLSDETRKKIHTSWLKLNTSRKK